MVAATFLFLYNLAHPHLWHHKVYSDLCHEDAKVLVERPVDAGNLEYTAPLCAATVRVEHVQTLQMSQVKTFNLISKHAKTI